MIFNKKGLSTVVATMLIILLTLTAGSILITIVVPYVKNSLDSTECFKFRDYYSFDESLGYSCYDEANNRYVMSIKVRTDETDANKIKGLDLRFLSDAKADVVEIKEGAFTPNVEMLDGGELVVPVAGGKYRAVTYNYTTNEAYDKVEVYPISTDGKICDKSDSIKISKC